jgi:hypothetical protein
MIDGRLIDAAEFTPDQKHASLGHCTWLEYHAEPEMNIQAGELLCEDCDYRTTDPTAIAEHFNVLKIWYEDALRTIEQVYRATACFMEDHNR